MPSDVFPPFPAYKSLSPPEQKLCLRVRRFLTHELKLALGGQTLLLAVSGGADSLALFSLALLLGPVLGHRVAVAHVDHGLRPESAREGRYVCALAAHWHIPCYSLTAPVREHAQRARLGLEEAARQLRYTLLEEARIRCGAQWICTGHHAGDLREDMLMRLTRGTGWPALGGMDALDSQRRLLRPLLLEEPQALRALLCSQNITWMEDRSNADVAFTRNRVRHYIVPALLKENPAFGDAARHLWRMAQDDAAYWERRLTTVCAEHHATFGETEVHLPASLLRELHRAERLRLYVRAVRHLACQGMKDEDRDKEQGKGQSRSQSRGQSRATTLYQLDEALTQGRGSTVFQLPGGINARLKCGKIIFGTEYR